MFFFTSNINLFGLFSYIYILIFNMEKLVELLEKIHPTASRFFINQFLVALFWFIPFILFKKEFLSYPFHIQMVLVFCISLVWYFVNCITFIVLFNIRNLVDKYGSYLLELTSVFSIISLCILTNVGYYHSYTITKFLQISFFLSVGLIFAIFLIAEVLWWTLQILKRLIGNQNN